MARQRVADGPGAGEWQVRVDLGEGDQDEQSVRGARMGNVESRLFDDAFPEKDQVDIQRSGSVRRVVGGASGEDLLFPRRP